MKAYKVVSPGLRSALQTRETVRVQYEERQWVRAPQWLLDQGFGALVFESLENARRFRTNSNEVWECETRGAMPLAPFALKRVRPSSFADDLLDPDMHCGWPVGSSMCEEVLLVKKEF